MSWITCCEGRLLNPREFLPFMCVKWAKHHDHASSCLPLGRVIAFIVVNVSSLFLQRTRPPQSERVLLPEWEMLIQWLHQSVQRRSVSLWQQLPCPFRWTAGQILRGWQSVLQQLPQTYKAAKTWWQFWWGFWQDFSHTFCRKRWSKSHNIYFSIMTYNLGE